MNCECNNKSNRVKPGIKHVYGNVLRMAIPLTLRTLTKDGDEMVVTDTDFIPSSDHPVRVVFSRGKTNYPLIATMDGNVAIVEDKGKIPVGTYDISVECYDDLGNPYRFKQNAVLYVADTTAEAGIDEEIEYEAQTWYLNAAVFLATTEIGEIGDAIDAKLDDVFGNVAYDANAKEIRFYNKDNSRVLATIDSRPFIADGTVADVYIDVSRQVLVVVLNEDAGGTRFSVPLYLVFAEYYKKDEVDNLVSRTVEGLRFDFSQELPLVVPVTKNGSSYSSPVDFGVIENAIREDGRLVVACVNNSEFYQLLDANRAEVSFSQVNALDGYQVLLIVDKHNVWSMEDVDLGTGGGGGGYEPPAGGIPKTDLAGDVQASLNKADTALQQSDLSGYATQEDVDDAISGLVNGAPAALDTLKELADALGDNDDAVAALTNQLANKVDKVAGKGLSTNDYTTAEKTKLAGLENYDDSALQTAIDGKVDKESGKSLMTDAERTKLQGIAAGAEVNVQPNWTQTNTSADDYIKNKPTLATVATSGSYNDLSNKPTIPAAYDDTTLSGRVTALENAGFITTETDPTVPSWAKQQTKPTYTAQEVGALPASTTIPTKTSDLTNDSGFTSNSPATATPSMDGTAAVGVSDKYAREDHVHPKDTSKQDVINDLATIRSGATAGATALQKSDVSVETQGDGTVDIIVGSGANKDTYTINLNHTHEGMAKLVVCEESDLPSTLDMDTIYAQVDDAETPTEIQSLWIAGLEFVGGGGAIDDTPRLITPRDGLTLDFDGQSTIQLPVRGKNLASNLSVVVTGDFTVTANGQSVSTIAAADVTDGASLTLTLTKGSNFISGSIEISSIEIDTARVSVRDSDLFDVLNGVKFTGSQWVNTGIGVGPNTSLKLDIEFINTFGASTSDGTFVSTSNAGFAFNVGTEGNVTTIYFWIQGKSVNKTYGNGLYARGVIDYSPGSISFLGQSGTTATKTTTSENLAIGYGWNKSQPIYNEQHFIVYGLKIYQNNVLTNDFVPWRLQNVVGLYDTINNVFISSETSTALVAVE